MLYIYHKLFQLCPNAIMLSVWLGPPLATVLFQHLLLCCFHPCWPAPLPETVLSVDSLKNRTGEGTEDSNISNTRSTTNNEFWINDVHSRSKRSHPCVNCGSLYQRLTAWQGFHHTRRDKRLLYSRHGYYLVVGNQTVTAKHKINRQLGKSILSWY